MAERKIIFLNTYGIPEEVNTTDDSFVIGQITINTGPVLSSTGINMQDKGLSGIDTITFTDVNGTIAGIENQNLLDKTASEVITGAYQYNDNITFLDGTIQIAGIQNQNLLDKTASEVITGAYQFNNDISFDNTSRTIAGIQNGNLVDKSAAETLTGVWDFSNGITIPNTPTGDAYAVNKSYVDGVAAGMDWKDSVRAGTSASDTDITLSGTQTIDGVSLVADDRVLVKNQDSNPEQNGIYVVASGAWSRADDADTWNELISAAVFVEEGTANADTGWVCTVDSGGTLGTTSVTWSQFSAQGSYTEGHGITISGNIISVDPTDIIDTASGLTESGDPNSEIQVNLETDGAIVFDGTNGGLEINIDGSTLAITTNQLKVATDGITDTEIDNDGDFTMTGKWSFAGGDLVVPTAVGGSPVEGEIYWSNRVLYGYDATNTEWVEIGSKERLTLTGGEAGGIVDGDVVYISAANTVSKARADAYATAVRAIGFADEAIANAAQGDVIVNGTKTKAGWGLTSPGIYYLSASTAGAITTTAPTGSGDWIIKTGQAINSTTILVDIDVLGRRS